VLGYQLESPRQDQSQRDKRNVDHAKINQLRDLFARKESCIHFFHHHHTRIVPQFPSQLTMTNVDREYFRRAALQQEIGKSPRRRANVERGLSLNIDSKKVERTAKFRRAATREFRRLATPKRGAESHQPCR